MKKNKSSIIKLIIILILIISVFVGIYLFIRFDKPTETQITPNDNKNNEERELRKELLKAQIEATKVQTQTVVMDKSYERVINPLLSPERSYTGTYFTPINIPTRQPSGGNQNLGYLYKESISNDNVKPGNNTDSTIISLFGHPTYNGSGKWNYYVTSDKYPSIKLPLTVKGKSCDHEFGCEEITNGDQLTIPEYNGTFTTKIYEMDKPRYLPNVL